jgi:hypothetical protein
MSSSRHEVRPKIDQLGEQAIPASRREAGRPRSGHVPEASGREAGQRLTSLVSTSVPFRLRQAVNALRSTAMLPTQFLANLGKTRAEGTGVEIWVFSRTVALPESANRQRATMQTPQGLDAAHGNELFPVDESRRSWRGRGPSTQEKPGAERTGVEIWVRGLHFAGQRRICRP